MSQISKISKVSILSLATALVAFSALPASAAEAPAAEAPDTAAPDAGDAGVIVVTAGKREENIQDVPAAITALDANTFLVGGVGKSASEVLTLVPNASAGTQQHGRPRWWIRGIGAGQQQIDLASPVGFYLDDVYISNANATGLPIFDVERVEVLRGPQGTLWGKNTTGGAINVIATKPSLTGKNDNYAKVDYGSYDDKTIEAGVGVTLVPDKLAALVSGHIENRDGRFYNVFTDRKDNGIEDTVLRGQLRAKPTDSLDTLLSIHYRKYKTDGGYWAVQSYNPNGIFRNGYIPPSNHDQLSTNTPDNSTTKQLGGLFRADWDIGPATLTSITGYERWTSESQSDNDYTPLEISRIHSDQTSRQWSQEVRLASPGNQRLSWIIGAHYFNEKIASDSGSATLPDGSVPALAGDTAPNAFSRTFYSHRARSIAAFGNIKYEIAEGFDLSLGGRWTRERKTLDFRRLNSASAAGTAWSNLARWWDSYTGTYGTTGTFSRALGKTWNAFTYDVTPTWHINRDNTLYFKFAHGVKSGGFNTAATLPIALQVVAPEKLDSFELGYKSEWLDGKLRLNATAFHYAYKNVQVNVVGPNPGAVGGATVSYLQNAAKAHNDGLELELQAQPIDNLSLNAALGLLNAKYDRFQVVNGGANLSGNRLVRAPKVTLNGGATYTVPLSGDAKVELHADARYQSLQYYFVTPQNNATRYLLNQPGYTIANARISYISADDRYTLSVYTNNFLNTQYRNHALPQFNAATGVTGDTIYWGDPRTYGASFTARF